jgi:superoxide dismutase, Fe-Mn family
MLRFRNFSTFSYGEELPIVLIPAKKSLTYPYSLSPLAFAYDAFEPYIDAVTMHIHHDKHHQAYITNLNAALKPYPDLHNLSIEDLLWRGDELPVKIRQTVNDQGGGHLHHQYFWDILQPAASGNKPSGALAQAIDRDFGSFNSFKKVFVEAGARHFGSGWVFLTVDTNGDLEVFSRSGHDNVLAEEKTVLLINDLWEHAYYLNYQNDRAEYLKAFWNVINWGHVNQRLESLQTTETQFQLVT